jgi:hypothetical protein
MLANSESTDSPEPGPELARYAGAELPSQGVLLRVNPGKTATNEQEDFQWQQD